MHWNPDAVIQNPAVPRLGIIHKNVCSLNPGKILAFFKIASLSGCNWQFGVDISVFPCTCQHQRESTRSCLQIRDIFHMCTLHSVLPNDYTLRYYAGKVATFCSICLRKREACLTPASWLWDIIPHNSLTAWLACGAAGFEWQAGVAKQAFPCLGWQAMRKPAICSPALCSWVGVHCEGKWPAPFKTMLPNHF